MIKDGFRFQRPAVQHVHSFKRSWFKTNKRELIAIGSLILLLGIVIAIASNVQFIRAQGYSLTGEPVCELLRGHRYEGD